MKGITFERERKGYSVEQVDAYIDVLQENYKKVASSAQKAEEAAVELEQQLDLQKEKFEAANRQFEEERKALKRRFLEQEAQLKTAGMPNNAELQQKLEQQLVDHKTENSKLNQQIDEKDQEINRMRDQMTAAEESWQEQLQKLTEEKQQLKAEEETSHNEKNNKMPEPLTELYTSAQEQVDAYVKKVKHEMEAERAQMTAERQAIIAQAEADAKKIEEEARQKKYDEFEEEKERLRIEQDERMAEIAYLKQEAEAERNSAKDEAESIIRHAQLKLDLAEKKDKILMEKAFSKSRLVESQMEEQYQKMHSTLTDTAKRMAELFEYITNINEAKSIEEIRKYGEGMEKEN